MVKASMYSCSNSCFFKKRFWFCLISLSRPSDYFDPDPCVSLSSSSLTVKCDTRRAQSAAAAARREFISKSKNPDSHFFCAKQSWVLMVMRILFCDEWWQTPFKVCNPRVPVFDQSGWNIILRLVHVVSARKRDLWKKKLEMSNLLAVLWRNVMVRTWDSASHNDYLA